MNDILSGISEILDDPETAEKITKIAKDLTEKSDKKPVSAENNQQSVQSLLNGINFKTSEKHITLLKAIKPYMRKERGRKIDEAVKLLSTLKTVSNLTGEGKNV